jgi:purine-cytosine permease-like protein
MVIGGGIAGVIDFPTYFQHAKSKKDGIITSVLLFGLALPFIEIVGVCLGFCFPHNSLLTCLIAGGGIFWGFVVSLFLIFAGWTTNNTNIYSVSINSKKMCPKLSQKMRTLIFGLLGAFLSAFCLLSHLSMVLTIMGILLGSMGAITLVSYLMDQFLRCEIDKKGQIFNLISFMIATTIGLLTFFGIFALTHLPILDAFIIAFITTIGLRFMCHKKIKTKEIEYAKN